MVSFKNMGRTGNFLFQAATSIGYARQHDLDFTVPSATANPVWNPIHFPHLVNQAFNSKLDERLISEKMHCYHDIEFLESFRELNIFLQGYWQSYQYFEFCRQEVLTKFNLPYIYDAGKVALHVRRGDYLLYHPHINPLATREYYEQAVRHFWLNGYRRFMVFSDDIAWCISEFQHPIYKGCEFSFSQGNGILEDLFLMSSCEHQIMSNSTYAWWGAWLNKNPQKLVTCPHEDNYYGPSNKHLDVSTLYPRDWKQIKYSV